VQDGLPWLVRLEMVCLDCKHGSSSKQFMTVLSMYEYRKRTQDWTDTCSSCCTVSHGLLRPLLLVQRLSWQAGLTFKEDSGRDDVGEPPEQQQHGLFNEVEGILNV